MSEYLLMGDIHLSDRPPSSCTDSYLDDILAILAAVGDLARGRGSRGIIWAGDVFHHKTPGRTSHRTVRTVIDLLAGYPCPTWVVPGNHDMLNDRLDSIDSTQPLGVLIASGALRLLNGWMHEHPLSERNAPVFGLPWLQRFTDDTVRYALTDYRDQLDYQRPALVVTHAPLYPLGQELPYENYPAGAWAEAMDQHGQVFYGHVHEPHGIHTAAGVTFCNPGALSRGSLHEHNLTREIRIAAWNSDTGDFELLPVPHKPATEVFRLVEAQKAKAVQTAYDDFIAQVGQARLGIVTVEAVLDHVRTLGLGDQVETTIRTLLEDVS